MNGDIRELCELGLNSENPAHWEAALKDIMALCDAQRVEPLTIRVHGEAARMALCDCLKGWAARRDGTWHVITTKGVRADVLALINDLGIRAKVMP